ncbi:OmpH family outer membrane protein [Candidatus Cardinium hertigii]|jgi:Skp family chaperone for outer membrane proteins|uniref:OmpH family outer membrane protein n=1 Tax=Candidatus Cardinium hertigii TaxID=247481 RepID=A0A3N2QCX1_9BACT|nr:OmpH family outer membrane protein [Candidatus Cardinium hertigii]ROT47656.1 OmpH family outer membrane protein [Candidatus Cardinium hertigii]
MNYKFLSALTLAVCMYTGVKADPNKTIIVNEAAKTAESVLKIGYVDVSYIFENLPEFKKSHANLQSFRHQLENQLQTKFKEYQEKTESAQQQYDTLTEAQKKQKSAEISKLQFAIQKLEQEQYSKFEEKQLELMKPLHDRLQEVINKIAEEYNYTFILNKKIDIAPIVYFAQKTFDISELVLERLKAMAPEEIKPPVIGPKNNADAKVPAKVPAAKPAAKSPTGVKKK